MERQASEPDAEATYVERPASEPDAEATFVERPASEPDAEATFVERQASEPDAEATFVERQASEPDAEATFVEKQAIADDPEATWVGAPPAPAYRTVPDDEAGDGDPDATMVAGSKPGSFSGTGSRHPGMPSEDDPEATIAFRARDGEASADEASVATRLQGLARLQSGDEPVAVDLEFLVGLNPLVAAANRVLSAVPQIRAALKHPDPGALRAELLNHIGKFEQTASAKGYDADTVAVGRYALCALVDESVNNTPWARTADWNRQGMLPTLYGEAEGGEKFFADLSRMEESPAAHIDALELFDVCIALGFEGRYRHAAGGRAELDLVRARLKEVVRGEHLAASPELSEHWRGLDAPIRRGSKWFVVWMTVCACAAILVVAYFGFRILLGTASEPAASALARLRAPAPAKAMAKPALRVKARLKDMLAQEIGGGMVQLQEDGQQSVVTIKGDELFRSGSTSIDARYVPVVLRVAQALDKVPGSVIVTGHTDNVPIRTARFSSNWELSRMRARSVAKLMAGEIADKARLRTEGLADSEPLVPNTSAANRAKNRRVTIILKVQNTR